MGGTSWIGRRNERMVVLMKGVHDHDACIAWRIGKSIDIDGWGILCLMILKTVL